MYINLGFGQGKVCVCVCVQKQVYMTCHVYLFLIGCIIGPP